MGIRAAMKTLRFLLTCVLPIHVLADCYDNGQWYKPGSTYLTKAVQGNFCQKYRCNNGQLEAISIACLHEGQCYDIDQGTRINQCTIGTCRRLAGKLVFSFKRQGCTIDGSTCLEPGMTLNRGCSTYICERRGQDFQLALRDNGCQLNGQCYPLGSEKPGSCGAEHCVKQGHSVDFVKDRPVCSFPDTGACYPAGSKWTHKCMTYRCNQIGTGMQTQVINMGMGCPGVNGCYPADGVTEFKKFSERKGKTVSCTCSIEGTSRQYSCY